MDSESTKSTATNTKKIISKKRILIIVIFVVLLLSVAATTWYLQVYSKEELPQYKQLLESYGKQQDERRTSDSIPSLIKYINSNPKNKDEKYRAEVMLSAAYQNQGDYENAKSWLKAAIADQDPPSFKNYVSLAEIDEAMNNKESALTNYQQALILLKQAPAHDAGPYTTYLEGRINTLKTN
jgi:tetratricopeptide (TPR) repeat protein